MGTSSVAMDAAYSMMYRSKLVRGVLGFRASRSQGLSWCVRAGGAKALLGRRAALCSSLVPPCHPQEKGTNQHLQPQLPALLHATSPPLQRPSFFHTHPQEKGTTQGQWWANAIAGSLAETPGEPWERVALRQMSGLVLVVFCRRVCLVCMPQCQHWGLFLRFLGRMCSMATLRLLFSGSCVFFGLRGSPACSDDRVGTVPTQVPTAP